MIDTNTLEIIPDNALIDVFMGACFIYSYNHDEEMKRIMYQLRAEILRRLQTK